MVFKRKGFKRRTGRETKRIFMRPRVCRFCVDPKLVIDYKDAKSLTPFTSERGKIMPRRISGNCARHQREITLAIKRARIMAIIPYSATQLPLS